MAASTQKILRIRRDYNAWVADESLEDYALRYTPRSFRKWSEWRVANTAFGAVSFLALEAIGAVIALNYGFSNALWAIVTVGIVTFLTGLPISYYAARYGLDLDLLTRGAGFGYMGSTLTSLIYASFTFIFFALEAAIMALALQLIVDLPLAWCYVISSLVIIPMVLRGITWLSRLQWWTQGLWLPLLLLPYAAVAWKDPGAFVQFTGLAGRTSGSSGFDVLMFGAAATVAFSLVVQIGEQVDYLRFLPEKTRANRWRWWAAVLVAGPGWIVPGMLKMLGGAFLAFLVLQQQIPAEKAAEPTQMYLAGFAYVFDDPAWVLAATALFVVVSQIKINVTNAYAGSLAWSNFFARLTHSHPGRVVWLVFNVLIAVLLMTLGVFQGLEKVLGLYGNVGIAWVGALVADLVINKPLGWSPKGIEFRRAYLYDINPVGLGATLTAALLAVAAYFGAFGREAEAFSPFIALGTALVLSPLLAWTTRGRWYLARDAAPALAPGRALQCTVCENAFESEDMAQCPAYGGNICSLCCTLESRCHDRCKQGSRAADQAQRLFTHLLPSAVATKINPRLGHYFVVLLSLCTLLAAVMGTVYSQDVTTVGDPEGLRLSFIKVFCILLLVAAVCSWWVVLAAESRHRAQEESDRQNRLLEDEVQAHGRTDAALQSAKDVAEAANQAKTRYVAGITHELRTPLNSILGYAQILLKLDALQGEPRRAVTTIQRSGEHLHQLINGLLDLARIEAGRLRLDPAPLPVRELLDDLVHMVEPQAAAKGLAFTLETAGRVPQYVRADAKRLRQILLNLLGNAVRFTDHGRITLRLDHSREVARLQVIDTGIGIAQADLERIFMPFERGPAGRRSGDPGTGLGLTITHLLTQLMGGELTVQSTPGQGSTFTVRLYLSEVAAPGPRGVTLHRPVSGYIGARRHLLVVDDHPTQRHMLAGMLLPLGFIVREAASGSECIDSVLREPPDAVLLDVTMDDIDGWETARLIRARGMTAVPIIMVSANAFENRPDRLAQSGAQAFVDKPVIESELLVALQRHLELEWVADLPQAAWAPPRAPESPRLPAEVASDLIALARLGHSKGLHESLDRLQHMQPASLARIAAWRRLVEHGGFEQLIDDLKPMLELDDAEAG